MESIIHGDEVVRAVASPEGNGPGSVRIGYCNEFAHCSTEDAPLHIREFQTCGLRGAMRELGLEVAVDMAKWAAIELPGHIVLDSAHCL